MGQSPQGAEPAPGSVQGSPPAVCGRWGPREPWTPLFSVSPSQPPAAFIPGSAEGLPALPPSRAADAARWFPGRPRPSLRGLWLHAARGVDTRRGRWVVGWQARPLGAGMSPDTGLAALASTLVPRAQAAAIRQARHPGRACSQPPSPAGAGGPGVRPWTVRKGALGVFGPSDRFRKSRRRSVLRTGPRCRVGRVLPASAPRR